MNRKILIGAVIVSIFALIGVVSYAVVTGAIDLSDKTSEVGSEVSSETTSEVASEPASETTVDPNEGVDTTTPPETDASSGVEGDASNKYDENGDLRENSKYLDDDGDTIANFYDICKGQDDFGSECSTTGDTNATTSNTDTSQSSTVKYDENGVEVSKSKYLDADGDTIANYYDICPGVDDFGTECDTDAYN